MSSVCTDLPPGDYYVTASTGPADAVRRDPPLFFPGTPSFSEAQSITLAVGNEAAADFQILPMRSARVSGIVFNASGAPVEAMVQLVSEAIGIGASIESAGPPPAFMINADTNADGRFTIDNVPPGPYVLTANSSFNAGVIAGIQGGNPNAGPPPAMREIMERGPETATMSIVVAGDNVSDLALTTRRGGVLAGSFVADAGVVRPLPNGVSAEVRPAKGGGGPSMMQGGRGSAFRLGRDVGTVLSGHQRSSRRLGGESDHCGWRGRHRRADRSEGPDELRAQSSSPTALRRSAAPCRLAASHRTTASSSFPTT